ncbi:MAG: hypothetical protein HRT69_10710 [Flavobacteriaceae bacterium]|nr:hypothetical protein [Flavobacteriaceae bacterium]
MKKIITLILATILFICLPTSCDSDDNNITQEDITTINKFEKITPLDKSGKANTNKQTWNLTNMSGGFVGINQDYNSGVIKWTFDTKHLILTIKNNEPKNSNYSGLKPGKYSYKIHHTKIASYLFVENTEYGIFILNKNNLIINQNKTINGGFSDGFIYTFMK